MPSGVIYYVQLSDGIIKIGYSANLHSRMKALRPEKLLAVERGTTCDERARHDQFVDYRLCAGEYFHPAPELMRWVADVSARPFRPRTT